MVNPVLVALDVPTAEQARLLAESTLPYVGGFKVGLEILMAAGPSIIDDIASLGKPVFCDAKLHDIPNTVAHAARQIGARGARWVTVHAPGGHRMVEAAVAGIASTNPSGGVFAVTVLTSLGQDDLAPVGVDSTIEIQVRRLARLAASAGAEGVVCSVADIPTVHAADANLVTVTPGIRPTGSSAAEQARVATPAEAVAAGATWLVIGRPISQASDPAAAAAAIASELR
jgi:orotidine-5'-phosphate decarboxylase